MKGAGEPEDFSLTNMADVRPVRQPWSRCVAHQESSSSSKPPPEPKLVVSGGLDGK